MDVLELIDRLDQLARDARPVPLSDQVRVDREAVFDLIDEMRTLIPNEVKEARRTVASRADLLEGARQEAEQLLERAREEATRLAGPSSVARLAEPQAADLLRSARQQADTALADVDAWADGHLEVLERNLETFLQAIRRGRERLQERSRENALADNAAAGSPQSS